MKPISKLNRFHTRVLLEWLGVPVADQPKKTSEAKSLLQKFSINTYDEYKKAYSIVVDRDLGEASKTPNKVLNYADASEILRNEVKAIESSAISEITSKYTSLSKELVEAVRTEATETINKEAKKFNRFEIKIGKSKAKEIKGALPEEFPRLIQLASARKNIFMVGPTGCGKTFIAAKIAEALELPFYSQSCSAGVSESAFSGWLIPIGKSGQFVYVSSDFVKAYEKGGVFLFDEIDASDPNVLVFLNQALANDSFSVAQRHEKPLVKKHKDFIAIGAANTGGGGADSMYHGRNALDEATLDRFKVGTVPMNYSTQVEEQIITNEKVLEWGRSIRKIIADQNLPRVMSTRTMIDAQDMINGYDWGLSEVEEGYFSNWSKEEMAIIASARSKWSDS